MASDNPDVTDTEPFEITKSPADTGDPFVRFEATVHPRPDAEPAGADLDHERCLIDNPDEHLHPHQEEVIEVLGGEYGVAIDGIEHGLSEGESITVPEGTAHRHWNPTSDPVRVAHEHHPARDSAEHARTMWALAQDGKTGEKGSRTCSDSRSLTGRIRGSRTRPTPQFQSRRRC